MRDWFAFDTYAAFGGAMTAVRIPLRDYLVFAARRGRAENDLGPDGWRALAEALKENTSLTTLYVGCAYVVARALLTADQCAIVPSAVMLFGSLRRAAVLR
eukprot:409004-Pleurochrysis_carterae.AAC.1